MEHTQDRDREDEFREAFSECDTNGNGSICYEEFATLMLNLGAEMDKEECRIGFGEIDQNGDGAIDFEEFFAWWVEQ